MVEGHCWPAGHLDPPVGFFFWEQRAHKPLGWRQRSPEGWGKGGDVHSSWLRPAELCPTSSCEF